MEFCFLKIVFPTKSCRHEPRNCDDPILVPFFETIFHENFKMRQMVSDWLQDPRDDI